MLFVAGVVEAADAESLAPALARMTATVRDNGTAALHQHALAGGRLAYRCGSVVHAALDAVAALLWRPLGEGRDEDASLLADSVHRYLRDGDAAIARFSGAFLLLLSDARSETCMLAVDRFGICPLYYAAHHGFLVFSSEADAVAAHPRFDRGLDPQALYDYVFFHCIPAPRTVYRAMRKLEPASVLTWRQGASAVQPYWMPSFAHGGADSHALQVELMARLDKAVASRVQPASGAFLSGGLDSSTVAGLLSRHAQPAATYTIGFDAAGYDESGYARIAAGHFGTDHHEYFVTPADVRESMPRIAAHYGEPFGNSSVIPTYQCARFAREHGVTLMLAGDGGDELFAGNTRYVTQDVFERYLRMPAQLRGALESGYRLLPWLARVPLAAKGARYIEQAKMGLPDRLQSYNFLNRFAPRSVFDGDWLSMVDSEEPWRVWRARYQQPVDAEPLQRMLYLDWKFTLADNDLVKVNRACALAGVDVSYPMLDTAVLELSTQLATADLLPGGQLRGFYKQAFAQFLPGEVITKSKHGFGLPFGVWMRTDQGLQTMVADAFASMRSRHIFTKSFLDGALRLFREDAADYYGELVWIVTMLELWMDAHDV